MISLTVFSSNTNPKWPVIVAFLNSSDVMWTGPSLVLTEISLSSKDSDNFLDAMSSVTIIVVCRKRGQQEDTSVSPVCFLS